MIRLRKPVQLLEWGEGTNTMNQCWSKVADGTLINQSKPFLFSFIEWLFLKRKVAPPGTTTLVVEVAGQLNRKNDKESLLKVMQQGEGMTSTEKGCWGEVACGRIKSVESHGNKTKVYLEIHGATKIGR